MTLLLSNNASTTLALPAQVGDLSLTLTSAAGFPVIVNPGDYFWATLSDPLDTTWEVVKVTATTGAVLTVLRGQDGTSALPWASGSAVEMRMNAQLLRDLVAANQVYTTALAIVMG